jgi:hypothetical protein
MTRPALLLACLLTVACDETHPAEPLPATQATCYFKGGGVDWQPAADCDVFLWRLDRFQMLVLDPPPLTDARPRAGLRGGAILWSGTTPAAGTRGAVCTIDVDTLTPIAGAAQGGQAQRPRYYAQGKGGCEGPLHRWDAATQMPGAEATSMDLRSFTFGTVATFD